MKRRTLPLTLPGDPTRPWQIEVTPAAQRSLRRLGRSQRERLGVAIARLPEGDVRRLLGMEGSQSNVSHFAAFVEALGGELKITAVFPDQTVSLVIPG